MTQIFVQVATAKSPIDSDCAEFFYYERIDQHAVFLLYETVHPDEVSHDEDFCSRVN